MKLIHVAPHNIRVNLERIHTVVCVPPPGRDGVISTFHKSFVDFLTTPGRAPENQRIMLSAGHRDLGNSCMEIIRFDCILTSLGAKRLTSPTRNSNSHLYLNRSDILVSTGRIT